jgi:hypothetical protein
MGDRTLRTGGLPLLGERDDWPSCPRCDLPMLFRAQLPLAATSLVAFDDDRMLLVFECHARSGGSMCDEGAVLIAGGDLVPRQAPGTAAYDVIVRDLGPDPERVGRIVTMVCGHRGALIVPKTVLHASPPSIAQETARSIADAGGTADLLASPATTLAVARGGRLVPFDDGQPGTRRTTLPPLQELVQATKKAPMRGLLGGATPGYRDHSFPCSCGRPTRTAVRFLAQSTREVDGVALGPAVAQVCIKCGEGRLQRLLMAS